MADLLLKVSYHFLSSALVASLAWALISSMESRSSRAVPAGYTSSISSRRFLLLLGLSVWTHIFVDIPEHGSLPRIADGLDGMVAALLALL